MRHCVPAGFPRSAARKQTVSSPAFFLLLHLVCLCGDKALLRAGYQVRPEVGEPNAPLGGKSLQRCATFESSSVKTWWAAVPVSPVSCRWAAQRPRGHSTRRRAQTAQRSTPSCPRCGDAAGGGQHISSKQPAQGHQADDWAEVGTCVARGERAVCAGVHSTCFRGASATEQVLLGPPGRCRLHPTSMATVRTIPTGAAGNATVLSITVLSGRNIPNIHGWV